LAQLTVPSAAAVLEAYVIERILHRLTEVKELLAGNIDVFNPEWLQQFGECSDPIFAAWLENYRRSAESTS